MDDVSYKYKMFVGRSIAHKIRGPRCAYEEDNIKIVVTETDMRTWTEFIWLRIASTLLLLCK
jgi:hypothetical protein